MTRLEPRVALFAFPVLAMLVGATPDSTLRATLKILDIGLGRTLFEESA